MNKTKQAKKDFEKARKDDIKQLTDLGYHIRAIGSTQDEVEACLNAQYEGIQGCLNYKAPGDVSDKVVEESYSVSLQLKGKPETKTRGQAKTYEQAHKKAVDEFPIETDKGLVETIECHQTLKFPEKDLEAMVKKSAPKPAGEFKHYKKDATYNF